MLRLDSCACGIYLCGPGNDQEEEREGGREREGDKERFLEQYTWPENTRLGAGVFANGHITQARLHPRLRNPVAISVAPAARFIAEGAKMVPSCREHGKSFQNIVEGFSLPPY